MVLYTFAASTQTSSKPTGFITEKYVALPASAIRPKGWLLNQLTIMRNGPTGDLDEVHNKIKNDNGWFRGQGDGWEETPIGSMFRMQAYIMK